MTGNVKVGLIGLGRMGQNHLRVLSLLKGAEVIFIYDIDQEKTTRIAHSNGVRAAQDVEGVLGEVEALIIASPTGTHADYIALAAPCVRNMLVEKPLADTAERAAAIARLADIHSLNIQVGFIERFNPAVQQLRNVLTRSGELVTVDFSRTNRLSSRITDVDVVTDLMVHDIDLALHLNGAVAEISAHGIARGGMIDLAAAVLTHENGQFSRILASRITDKKMRLIQATCRDMFVECDLLRKEISITRQAEVVQPEGEPYTIIATEETLEVRPQEALLLELQCFLQGCKGVPGFMAPDIAAGVAAMRVCTAIQETVLSSA